VEESIQNLVTKLIHGNVKRVQLASDKGHIKTTRIPWSLNSHDIFADTRRENGSAQGHRLRRKNKGKLADYLTKRGMENKILVT